MITLSVKLIFKVSLVPGDVHCLDDRGSTSMVALDGGSHGIASPLTITVPRTSQSSTKTLQNLVLPFLESSKGRFLLQFESPPLEWWAHLLRLCRHIPASGVLQVSRPQGCPTEMVDTVKSDLQGGPHGLCRVCFLNGAIPEVSMWLGHGERSRIESASTVQDSCARAGAFFASLLDHCQRRLKFILCDIFSIASLINLYGDGQLLRPYLRTEHSQADLHLLRVISIDLVPVPSLKCSNASPPPIQLAKSIEAKKLKTIFVLVPFRLDCDSRLTTPGVPDVATTVGRLFAEGRLEIAGATLVVWACYPREPTVRGDFSQVATECRLREELDPHIEALRNLPPIRRVSGSGPSESCLGRPFRKVEFRMCPYDQWHAGGIAEIPEEVWEVILRGIEADSNASPGPTAEARTGEEQTAEASSSS